MSASARELNGHAACDRPSSDPRCAEVLRAPARIAMLSVHTCPLAAPGGGFDQLADCIRAGGGPAAWTSPSAS